MELADDHVQWLTLVAVLYYHGVSCKATSVLMNHPQCVLYHTVYMSTAS
jgi:hypothetical protein